MEGKSTFPFCIFASPQKIFSVENDVISMFVHVLSFECCEILQTFECRSSLLWTVGNTLFMQSSKSVLRAFKIQCRSCLHRRNVHDFSCEQKAVVWLCVHQHVIHFIVLEVRMPCSCSHKAKLIQSRVRKQNNRSFDKNSRRLAHRRNRHGLLRFTLRFSVIIKHGVWISDWV